MSPQDILDFWFEQTPPENWFVNDSQFDATIRERFTEVWQQAARAELSGWRGTIRGRLAEIIVLDQFSRNIGRGTPVAFAQDSMALVLSQEASRTSEFAELTQQENNFLLMPMMHSESTVIHQAAECLFRKYGSTESYQFELKHKAIIDAFGRYPHRNEILGRESTPEELAFLKEPGSSF
ncbi:membrane protein [Advenella kashmirensis W13003]|uniref:Membrane protein n=1 Tax=Advenella kashmirensis W13003 TaxID=1424334 RepID=V8QYI3_9BURK|nr:DUF924 family protein [Advenella kashmirensis]ETF04390.1 membrane protein [Advenella kashmirensis W13003]